MKSLIDLCCQDLSDTPPIVANAMRRLQKQLSEPAKPLMSQEEYEKLPHFDKCMLVCNMPGCGKVVSTHHLLCVDHINGLD